MRCLATLLALVCAAAVWLRPTTFAHGSIIRPPLPTPYDGPGDVVRGPGGRANPPTGPATPPPSPPSTPGPSGPTPGPGGKAPATPGSNPLTGLAGGGALESWQTWWGFNSDPYLQLRAAVREADTLSGSDDFFLGFGATATKGPVGRPTETALRELVGPALLRVVREERDAGLISTGMMALAKIAHVHRPADGARLGDVFAARLSHANPDVVDSAVVALGLAGNPADVPLLVGILRDDEAVHARFGRRDVPTRVRAFAAFALGVLAGRSEREEVRRYVAHHLVAVLDAEEGGAPDVAVACVTALGMVPLALDAAGAEDEEAPAAGSRAGQLRHLAEILADERARSAVRGHVPRSLARLAAGAPPALRAGVVEGLLDALESRRSPSEVKRGAVLALGMLADADEDPLDARVRVALERSLADGDALERPFALVALALSSSRPGKGAGDSLAAAGETRALLLRTLARGRSQLKPWAGLALGLQGHRLAAVGIGPSVDANAALRASLEGASAPESVGAFALALGLRRDAEASGLLREKLEDIGDEAARGHVAVALGLLGERAAVARLEELLKESRWRPVLLRESATGLALLGEKRVVDDLLETLRGTESTAVLGAVVAALGLIGDARTIDALVEVLGDEDLPDVARTFAAGAIGAVCEEQLLPWTAAFANDLNYAAITETLNSPNGTGVLNLR